MCIAPILLKYFISCTVHILKSSDVEQIQNRACRTIANLAQNPKCSQVNGLYCISQSILFLLIVSTLLKFLIDICDSINILYKYILIHIIYIKLLIVVA